MEMMSQSFLTPYKGTYSESSKISPIDLFVSQRFQDVIFLDLMNQLPIVQPVKKIQHIKKHLSFWLSFSRCFVGCPPQLFKRFDQIRQIVCFHFHFHIEFLIWLSILSSSPFSTSTRL